MTKNNNLNTPVTFASGKTMKNRFMLSPLTNLQSHEDGTLSDIEFNWLTKRAEGQFGLVMTCATSIQHVGKCWSGQLGIHEDKHIEGHQRLVQKIKEFGSLAVTQLHHGGMRSDETLTGKQPVAPSDVERKNARGLTLAEVEELRDDFIEAAVRAQKAGYDGVEVHGAHGYMLTQFISKEINQRSDQYGGSLENRSRILFEIVEGIRQKCGEEFLVGVRLSPERFGMEPQEIKTISQQLIDSGQVDFLDLSLWDVFKSSEIDDRSLMDYFVQELDSKNVKLTVAGKVRDGQSVHKVMEAGIDFVTVGTAAILHHDFPVKVLENSDFQPVKTPVSIAYLQNEGLGEPLINYLRDRWPDFVAE